MRRHAVSVAALVVFALVAAIVWVPWFTEKRGVIAATPVPPPLFGVTPAPVGPGKQACFDELTMAPNMQIAQIGVQGGDPEGPPLVATASGEGYRSTMRIPGGYTSTQALRFDFEPPPEPLIGKLCIRNAGERPVELIGTNEFRTMGRPNLTIDGQPQQLDAHLAFFEREPQSYAQRVGDVFSHAAAFTPPLFPAVVLGLLALLALVGIPAGVILALAAAARGDDAEA